MKSFSNVLAKNQGGIHKYACRRVPEKQMQSMFPGGVPVIMAVGKGLLRVSKVENSMYEVRYCGR